MLRRFKDTRTGQIFIPTGITEIARMETSKYYEEIKEEIQDSTGEETKNKNGDKDKNKK